MMLKKTTIFLCAALLLSAGAFAQRKDLMASNYSTAKQVQNLDAIIADELEREFDNSKLGDTVEVDNEALLIESNNGEDFFESAWCTSGVNANRVEFANLPDSVKFDLSSYSCPLGGNIRITSRFGMRRYRYHYGTDFGIKVGDSIRSSFDGKIRVTRYDRRGYGWYVVVRHENGLETLYGHLSKILVEDEQTVKAGEVIALGGNTGRSTGPHLHFEVRFLGNPLNPEQLFDFQAALPFTAEYLMTKKVSFAYKAEAERVRYHTVRKGETLSSIAKKRGTTVARIKKLNRMGKRNLIRPGQRLRYS